MISMKVGNETMLENSVNSDESTGHVVQNAKLFIESNIKRQTKVAALITLFAILGFLLFVSGFWGVDGNTTIGFIGIVIFVLFGIIDISCFFNISKLYKYSKTLADYDVLQKVEELMAKDQKVKAAIAEQQAKQDKLRAVNNERKQKLEHPKCPVCGGNHTKRITTARRAVSVGVVGLASNKIGKSFECLDCKYTW